ncbi:unnamed protein product [Euphydryas editha]|uniref:unspecific monooxygenase n=1 Tax=Euphydryas editha TaxID=104508 RepID=A0AAU9V7E6_EUPED|nr:unnamed protein product [Euphydryas editha]
MIFVVWGIILVTVLAFYIRQTYSRFSNYGVKHFKTLPFLGNMTNIILGTSTVAEELTRLYYDFRDERFVGRYEFTKPTIVVNDLDLLKKITIKDFEHFLDHRQFVDEENDALFARSLFSLRGEEWKEMRATLSPAFTGSKLKQMVPFMEEVGNRMILVLKKQIKESKSDVIEIDIKDLTSRYTNDVIFSCAFGLQVDSHSERENQFYKVGKMATTFSFRQAILYYLGAALPWLVKILNLRFYSNTTKEFFTNIVLNTMKDRESQKIMRPDMIQILMDLKKGQLKYDEKNGADTEGDTGFATAEESAVGKKKVDREWSDVDLIAQAVVFFLAGYETIATATAFTLHELALNPEVQERLAKEIKEHDAKNGGKVNFNSIQNLTYMDMVISESLRMWPPLMQLDRVCVKDYNMGKPNPKAPKDYIVRKGEYISIPAWPIHRDPEFYPNPDKFDPERFSPENKHKINPFTYMPFGIGPRNCIGSRFALCECKVMLYQILLHTEVFPSGKTCIPSKLSSDSLSSSLQGGHWLNIKARS